MQRKEYLMQQHEFYQQLLELRPRLIGWARRCVRSDEDAEDLVQDTLVKAIAAWETFDPDRGSLKTWVSTILNRRDVDIKRSMAYRLTGWIEDTSRPILVVEASQEAHCERMEALLIIEGLSESTKDVLILTLIGYSDAEIAKMRCIPLGTVKSRIQKSRVKVQRGLAHV